MIFVALKYAMKTGSVIFTSYSSLKRRVSSSSFPTLTLMAASFCLNAQLLTHNESVTFWFFFVFEIYCGMYFLRIAHLKGNILGDRARAKICGTTRVLLNVFEAVGLMLTKTVVKPIPGSKNIRLTQAQACGT
jgi:hypothetical protein